MDLHPLGHSNRSDSLHNLALYFSCWYDKQGTIADLEQAITLGRAALDLRSPGHSGHAWTLNNLANDMTCKFQKFGANGDLNEAFSLQQLALDLRLAGQSDWLDSLHDLALCCIERYNKQGTLWDLKQAITLSRAALELCPPGHSDHAWFLNTLGYFIKFKQAALVLHPEGHPDHAESLNSLLNYRHVKIKGQGVSTQSAHLTSTTSGSWFKYLIGNIVFDVLKEFPPCLLATHTGMLCDRDSQIAQFEKSREYNQLLSSVSVLDDPTQVTCICEVVSTYF